MNSYARIASVDLMLKDKKIEAIGRINKESFTRKRKMDFYEMATSIILKKGQTLTLELNEFMETMKREKIFRNDRNNVKIFNSNKTR